MRGFQLNQLFGLHQTLRENKIILAFESSFSQDVVKKLLTMTENRFDAMGEDASLKKKVFNVMVECLQNICKHIDEKEDREPHKYGLFLIGKNPLGYFVISGNIVHNAVVSELSSKINEVNQLDKEGLKELYKKKILETSLSDKGGAGLGLIDMARKSGQKIEYQFIEINEQDSFFAMKTNIAKEKQVEA